MGLRLGQRCPVLLGVGTRVGANKGVQAHSLERGFSLLGEVNRTVVCMRPRYLELLEADRDFALVEVSPGRNLGNERLAARCRTVEVQAVDKLVLAGCVLQGGSLDTCLA